MFDIGGESMERVILHSDLNCFFAGAEMSCDPSLRGKPIAVVGDPERRHGIILTKSYEAARCGVSTGQAIWQARQLCPELILLPADFPKYQAFAREVRRIYLDYSSMIEPFGIDESWLDVTESMRLGSGRQIADELRTRIWEELGLHCSVGVSFNKVFAKLGSDYKKPDATTEISRDNFKQLVWPLPAEALLYVGRATRRKLNQHGIFTIGGLAAADAAFLERLLGVNGRMLHQFANGEDTARVADWGMQSPVKSVGNSTTAPRDLVSERDVRITLRILCESVAERLRRHGLQGSCLQLSLRRTDLSWSERQGRFAYPVSNSEDLLALAWSLFRERNENTPLRGLGVRVSALTQRGDVQLSYLPDRISSLRQEDLEQAVDHIRGRFGHGAICRALTLCDRQLSDLNPVEDHTTHPTAFLPTLHWEEQKREEERRRAGNIIRKEASA